MSKAGEIQALKTFAERYGDELPSKHELDVAATFQLSWDQLGETARRTLRAIAEMAPAPVPVRILRTVLEMEEIGLKDPLGNSLAELERLSLAERDEECGPSIHRLVRSFVIHIIPREESLHAAVAEALDREMVRVKNQADTQAYRELDQIVPHAEVLARADGVWPQTNVDLWDCVGTHHQNHGRYVLAKGALTASLQEAEASFEPGHPSIAISQSNLALVLQGLGELAEARDLLRRAYRSFLDKLGPNHPNTKTVLGNLRSVGGEPTD